MKHVDVGGTLDLVIRGGRVLDPESGLDARRDVGIQDGRVVVLAGPGSPAVQGREVLDAQECVVAPGFIDLHSHTPTRLGQRFSVLDGVTTALDLEAGAFPVSGFGTAVEAAPLINFGASAGYSSVRLHVLEGADHPALTAVEGVLSAMGGPGFTAAAGARHRPPLRELLGQALHDGGLGVGLLLDYMSDAVDDAELTTVFDVAASFGAPVFVHVRRGLAGDPQGLLELVRLSESTGAPLHVCHVNASAMGCVASWLDTIREAQGRRVDVTTELFPYTAGSTSISAEVFRRDWRRIFDIDYTDVQWSATGEWLTESSWHRHLAERPDGLVIHHYMQEAWLETAMRDPGVVVSSDAMPLLSPDQRVAPNGMGTFSRVLGRYTRDFATLGLLDAVSRMTLLPARRLEKVAPLFSHKGRVRPGADADLTVFDPVRVSDLATYEQPLVASTGVRHVVVGGQPVVREGQIVAGVAPGRRLLASEPPRP